VSTEKWADERERIVSLLAAIESGTVTHVDMMKTSAKRQTLKMLLH
jgi:hypothetical protein